MVEWIALADPAHQIGLQPTLHAFLIAVESGCRGVEEWSAGIFTAKFGMVLLVAPHLVVLWSNGLRWRIQRIKLVYNQPSTLF
jgi:hypothetical protein